jgi:hypothetical protein
MEGTNYEVAGHLRRSIIKLLDLKILEYTVPENPRSKIQKYCLTDLGRVLVEGARAQGDNN